MTCTNSPSSHGPTFPPGPPCTRLLLSAGGTPHTDHNGIRIYCSPSFIKRRHNGERDRGQFEAGLTLPNLASGASVPNYPSAARRDRSRVRWAPSLLPTPRPPSASRATGRTCRRVNPVLRTSSVTDQRRRISPSRPPTPRRSHHLTWSCSNRGRERGLACPIESQMQCPPRPLLTGRTKSVTPSLSRDHRRKRSKQAGSGSAAWLEETREDQIGSSTASPLPGVHHIPDSRETGWPPQVLPPYLCLSGCRSSGSHAWDRSLRFPLRCVSSNQPLDPFLPSLTNTKGPVAATSVTVARRQGLETPCLGHRRVCSPLSWPPLVRLGNPERQYQAPSYSSPGRWTPTSLLPSSPARLERHMYPDHPGGVAPKYASKLGKHAAVKPITAPAH